MHCAQYSHSTTENESDLLELVRKLREVTPVAAAATEHAPVRVRAVPNHQLVAKHDTRGDAVALIVEHLQLRHIPIWAAYGIACSLVNNECDQLNTQQIPFDENIYETIDGATWRSKVFSRLNTYLDCLASQSAPLPEKPASWDLLPFSICEEKHRRPKMEDRAIALPTLSVLDLPEASELHDNGLFAVFDGHNGAECASYSCAHFARCLVGECQDNVDARKVMEEAFVRLDQRLRARCVHDNNKSGTTAVCAWLRGNKDLCVGWCGDSSAAIMTKDSVCTLTTPHSPNIPEEVKRVEEAGGVVVSVFGELRVNGVLNLTRALGDIDGRPMISSEPSIVSVVRDGSEYLLFVACDGVWNVLNESEIYTCVSKFVNTNPLENYAKLSEFIVSAAKDAGSTDNLTLISVYLRPVKDVWKLFGASK